ncbi:MAG: hypothetical protein AB7Y74_00810 [Syntrophorhabdus sp.]
MKIIGLLVILNALILTGWWVSTAHSYKPWVVTACTLAIFMGIFMILQDRAIEISLKGIGTIKAAAHQASVDASAIATLKTRVEAQSATVDLVAATAVEARTLVDELSQRAKEADVKINRVEGATLKAEALTSFLSVVLAAENDSWQAFQELEKWVADIDFPLREVAANAYTRIRISYTGPIDLGCLNPTWTNGFDPDKVPIAELLPVFDALNPAYHASVVKTVSTRTDLPKRDKMEFFMHALNHSNSLNAKNYAAKFFIKSAAENEIKWEPFNIDPLSQWWAKNKDSFDGHRLR